MGTPREGRFLDNVVNMLVPVTKTERYTQVQYTATTAVTLGCTPVVSIFPPCP